MGLPPPPQEQLDTLETLNQQLASLRQARSVCGQRPGPVMDDLLRTLDVAIAARVEAVQEATPH
eukprot:12907082-Prorocentrum_lima.AAC.1